MPTNILFLGLTTFSQTGGIEKFNKCFLKVLDSYSETANSKFAVAVLHDEQPDQRYIDPLRFKGYKGRKMAFVLNEVAHAREFDTIILAHLNLAPVGFGIKKLFPSRKLIVIIHGIEAMEPITGIRKKVLELADEIWTVSEFTRSNLVSLQQVPTQKIVLFHNTIDPFFHKPATFEKPSYLIDRFQIKPGEKILLSLTRLNHREGYKGYDQVIRALPAVLKRYPNLRYFIAGKGDEQEIELVKNLVRELNLEDRVELLGFVKDDELTDHYLLSDLFVLPSKKEGFGIVFIEAMACGLPVVAGNKDGSVDALRQGELGTLVDPDSVESIAGGILESLNRPNRLSGFPLQQKMLQYFGFEQYQKKLLGFLNQQAKPTNQA